MPRKRVRRNKKVTAPSHPPNNAEAVEVRFEEAPQQESNLDPNIPPFFWYPPPPLPHGYSNPSLSLMNGNVSQPIAPRAVFNNQIHEAASENNLDAILSSERLEGGKYKDELVQTVPQPSVPQEIPREILKKNLTKQLNFYFSTQNLASDRYLLSQMDKEQFVPIWTVANFNLIKKLTNDIELITEALAECVNVQLNESRTKVRPNYQRCVVILREISQDTPVEDVKELISGEGCPSSVSCEFAGNNAWYISYATDDDAQAAYTFIRENVKEFRGKPIHARIKARPTANVQAGGTFKSSWTPQPTNAVYDPASYPPNQQRFMYANGGTHAQMPLPPNQFYYQQFAPGPLIPYVPWQTNGFFDISTVFQVNGLAPQAPHKTPFKNNGKSKKKTTGQPEQGPAATCSNAARLPQPHMAAANRSNANIRGPPQANDLPEASMPMTVPFVSHALPLIDMSLGYGYVPQPLAMAKEPMPPRHRRRRRDEENVAGPSQPQEVEQRTFDLGHSAFPPLKTNSRRINTNSAENQEELNAEQPSVQAADTMPWSDHRIVDILRGNTASKSSSPSTSSKGSLSANDNESPRAGSPRINDCREAPEDIEAAFSSALTLTPPISPEKNQDAKCTMTDKSTKTDDVLLNGESEVCPTTTNAATMTTGAESSTARIEAPKPSVSSNTPPRMSYAQVAQHPKEGGNQKEKNPSIDGESPASSLHNGDKKGKDIPTKQEKTERNKQEPSRSTGAPNGLTRRQRKARKNLS
ncbi:la-related protein 4 isoform X2 [Coccinella septempunctata]|uniref:la-related protein 4 isoform X2 n=1 Tax=Coccinella septempunctata TaxID=41139 RepID=UPI001D088B0A|nr:la-related protein 4 isoform X2 [Coccinella septempunctata]